MKTDNIVLKYAPKSLDELLLPDAILERFRNEGYSNHLLLTGTAGLGKTSFAKALASHFKWKTLFLNGSEHGKIDMIPEIRSFAMSGGGKGYNFVLIDEAEKCSEEFFKNFLSIVESCGRVARFVLTANHIDAFPHLVKNAIQSRFERIDFNAILDDSNYCIESKKKHVLRILSVCEKEGISIEKPAIVEIVNKTFPDFRVALTKLQAAAQSRMGKGPITASDITGAKSANSDFYALALSKQGDPEAIFNTVAKHYRTTAKDVLSGMAHDFFPYIQKHMPELYIKKLPNLCILLAKYQYEVNFAIDPTITLSAFIFEARKELGI